VVAPKNEGIGFGPEVFIPSLIAVDVDIVTALRGPLLDNPEPMNELLLIFATELPIVIVVNVLHPANALSSILATKLPIVTLFNVLHPTNASRPILLVTVLGIKIDAKLIHDSNALAPIV
jgi:hypothetical protein